MLLSQAPMAGAVSLIALEEPVTTLVSPPNAQTFVSPMTYANNGISNVATTITASPLLCANTSPPVVEGTTLNPVYYSANGLAATTPLPFVFGAAWQTPAVSAMASGAQGVGMSPTEMRFVGDALGSLVCYGLNADGTRRLTRDVFEDPFDGGPFNSSVVLSVLATPSQGGYYKYVVDVTIPALPANTNCSSNGLDCNFVIEEGYDTSVFSTSSGGWCQAQNPTDTACSGPTSGGDINLTLQAPVAPAAATTVRFIVYRVLNSGATLPNTGAPVALAVLFSPNDLAEDKLDDNVSAGNNSIANVAPTLAVDATNQNFAGSLYGLAENTDSGTLTFDITDKDTLETASNKLSATVALNLPGNISVPIAANCSNLLSAPGSVPVTRGCTIDIPLNNGAFWNAQVGPSFANAFNVVATDTTNGSYATGVSASLAVVITDPLGKTGSPTPLVAHIHSTANNAPVLNYTGALTQMQDPKNGNTYATYSCSIGAGSNAGGCGAAVRGSIYVDLTGVVAAAGGPPAAFDEVASQTTAVVPFADPGDSFTNVQCTKEQTAAVFAANGGPIVSPGGSPGQFDMNFLLPTTPPTSAVSALCTLTIADVGPFPNNQSAATANKQFRVVVNP